MAETTKRDGEGRMGSPRALILIGPGRFDLDPAQRRRGGRRLREIADAAVPRLGSEQQPSHGGVHVQPSKLACSLPARGHPRPAQPLWRDRLGRTARRRRHWRARTRGGRGSGWASPRARNVVDEIVIAAW